MKKTKKKCSHRESKMDYHYKTAHFVCNGCGETFFIDGPFIFRLPKSPGYKKID